MEAACYNGSTGFRYERLQARVLTQILVLSDTHVRTVHDLPAQVLRAVSEAEWVVHCGDYTRLAVVDELKRLARNFVGVYGNADPGDIRRRLPAEVVIKVEARRIAVIHPAWGGYPDALEESLIERFPDVDAILFGHTHDPCNHRLNGTMLFNPGQGYGSFMVPASIGMLTISKDALTGEILVLNPICEQESIQ